MPANRGEIHLRGGPSEKKKTDKGKKSFFFLGSHRVVGVTASRNRKKEKKG